MSNLKRKIKIVILVGFVLFAIASGLIIWDGLTDELGKADVGILFGNQVLPSGEPSARLLSRLEKAVELYNDNYFEMIIVSGGLGKEGHDEALVMKDHLISEGIPETNILVDSDGLNTYMTIANTLPIIEENDFNSVMVISNYFHIPRIKMACNRFGIETVYSGHAHYFGLRDVYSITREIIAYGYYMVRSYP